MNASTPPDTRIDIERLDDAESFLNAFEPSYAVVVITDHIYPGRTASFPCYWGPNGIEYGALVPEMLYNRAQALVALEKAQAETEQSAAVRDGLHRRLGMTREVVRRRVELRFADEKLAQKNQAKREARRRAYQRRKERERLNPALAERRKLARRHRQWEKDEERWRRILAWRAAMAQLLPEERVTPAVERWMAGAD